MILAFNQKFVQPILEQTKIHTIRLDIANRWKTGTKIHMATGVRTKHYNQFSSGVVMSIQKIEIIRTSDYLEKTIVKVDGRQLTEPEVQKLAWNDGFSNLVDFWLYFADGFTGKLIHWSNLKY